MKSIGQVFSADDVVTAAGGVDSTAEDWYIGKSFNRPATRDDVIPLDTSEEESMPQWMAAQRRAEARRAGAELELADNGTADAAGVLTTSSILSVIKTERGGNVIVLDVAGKCDWTETMIIVDGGSTKQLYSIIDSAKKFIATDPSLPRSLTIEGVDSDDWMVLDLGRFVIHALTPEARAHYDIEGLWTSIRPESASVERRLMSDEEYEKEMLASVERAWEARPTTLVKTKQTEAEDLSDEQDVIKRINNAEVVRPQ
ncbi:Mitochondrial assembly of ribosomal large subunit protein 1 [Irineochytrium annulatum]|nr:Mitochondrial assembly of ribosomal large subunit protein 1 [Irineochytrium annulatum]